MLPDFTVGKSNQLLAALLLHLAEVEARGLHRKRLCASLPGRSKSCIEPDLALRRS
jgi:hypothetical protein